MKIVNMKIVNIFQVILIIRVLHSIEFGVVDTGISHRSAGQLMLQQGAQRGEDRVVAGDLQHGQGHVGRGFEGELPVEGEVPEHGEHQGDQIAHPVGQMQQLIEQGKAHDLDEPGADGEEGERGHPDPFFFLVCFHK